MKPLHQPYLMFTKTKINFLHVIKLWFLMTVPGVQGHGLSVFLHLKQGNNMCISLFYYTHYYFYL